MNVSENPRRREHIISGSAVLVYDFPILDENDIEVIQDGVTLTFPQYQVTGVGNDAGGTVILFTAPSDGTLVVLLGKQPIRQLSQYTVEGFPPSRIQNDLNKATISLQQHDEILARTLKLAKHSLLDPAALPDPSAVDLFLAVATLSPLSFQWKTLQALAGAVGIPLALTNGGTGASYASISALTQGLGAARWASLSLTPSGGTLTLPNPLTGNRVAVGAGPLSVVTASGVAAGTLLVFDYVVGGNVLTDGTLFQLQGRANYTTTLNDRSLMLYTGTEWVEVARWPVPDVAQQAQVWHGDGTFKTLPAQTLKAGVGQGLLVSNSAVDANNDIVVGVGDGVSDDPDPVDRVSMYLASALTKQLDADWAAGDNAGMRIAGQTFADGTWHVFLFRRSGGAIDICASNVLTGFTLPDGGTHKLRIFSLVRLTGIRAFVYNGGKRVLWKSPTMFFDANITATASNFEDSTNGSVPKGIPVDWIMMTTGNAVNGYIYPSPLDAVDLAPSSATAIAVIGTAASGGEAAVAAAQTINVRTNTLGQIRMRASATKNLKVSTLGYDDVTLLR